MNESQVRELLRNQDQHTVVGSPPHAAIVALARRRRHTRAVVMGSAALATAIVVSVAATHHMFGTQASSLDHHVVATQTPTPDNTDAPTTDDAAFQGTWRVVSMATFDRHHPHEQD